MCTYTIVYVSRSFGKAGINRRATYCYDRCGIKKTTACWHTSWSAFLAYLLWKMLGQLCHRAGLSNEPRRVLKELCAIRLVDVVSPTKDGCERGTRCVTQPSEH